MTVSSMLVHTDRHTSNNSPYTPTRESERASHVMASIGHELRHAIEVIDDPSVTNSSTMFFLYQRIGSQGTEQGAMETPAAVAAGDAVRSEVRAFDQLTIRRHLP